MNKNFADINELRAFVAHKGSGGIVVTHLNLTQYPGMVLYIGIGFDCNKAKYELNLEWMCLGLDFYGDTLQVGYLYKFDTLEALLEYLDFKYQIKVFDIQINYKFDTERFPNMLKDEAHKPLFEEAWLRFRQDFSNKLFLDSSLQLVHTTHFDKQN